MKSKIIFNDQNSHIIYPWIGISRIEDIVVLFYNPCMGIVVWSRDGNNGKYDDNWDMYNFEKFTGKVTIEND